VTGSEFLTAQLALKAWQDGRGEGIAGLKLVAFCIRNRVRAGFYGGDWDKVLSHHQEWSSTLELPDQNLPDPREPAFRAFLQEVDGIFSGRVEDNVTIKPGGAVQQLSAAPPVALYYARLDSITNPWFLQNISQNVEQHRIIGNVGSLHYWY
jgi:hypothetical protein